MNLWDEELQEDNGKNKVKGSSWNVDSWNQVESVTNNHVIQGLDGAF